MTQTAMCYGEVLYRLEIPREAVDQTSRILTKVPEVMKLLDSPAVSPRKKERIIDRIFPEPIRNFLKVVCRYGNAALLPEIFEACHLIFCQKHKILPARLTCVTMPDPVQEEGIRAFLKKHYSVNEVILDKKQDNSLMGGFLIEAAGQEMDCSLKGRLAHLEQKLTQR